MESDGTIDVPAEAVPISKFLTPEAKAYMVQHLHDMQTPDLLVQDSGVPRFMKPYVERDKVLYPLAFEDTKIGGVHVFVYTPKDGVDPANKKRVLINLHGGGFTGCWPACAELESMPIASTGHMRVVSVDYRQGPDNRFPAASEDVANVYRELLKTYAASNIGIYGCSAGGMFTGMALAWFQQHALPTPGAVGIFCASLGQFGGDAAYTSTPLGEARFTALSGGGSKLGYFTGSDPKSPLVAPLQSDAVIAKFPPTLMITGTRDFAMSGAVYTHANLVRVGVDADLHVWEGLFHGFFYDPDVPESKEAYAVTVRFFDKHLGKK